MYSILYLQPIMMYICTPHDPRINVNLVVKLGVIGFAGPLRWLITYTASRQVLVECGVAVVLRSLKQKERAVMGCLCAL